MEMYVFSLLLLGFLVLRETWAGSHSLKYFYTTMSRPGLAKTRFISVTYVDDQQVLSFDSDSDSDSQSKEPRMPWIEHNYWERETRISREATQRYRMCLQKVSTYYNHSEGGVHTFQSLSGCEVFSNGSFSRGFVQYAYDGLDFLALDMETLLWIAGNAGALNRKRELEEQSLAKYWKGYLEGECVYWLQKYLDNGKETLLRTDPPSVIVTRHISSDGEVTLRCRAQGFYPAEISLTWLRDGEEQLQETELIETRPAGDGTFQKWAALGMLSGSEQKYTCRVQHEGLPEPLFLKWGCHSMKYFDTMVTGPRLGLEERWFMTVGYADDQQLVRFHSDYRSQSMEPRAPWIELGMPDWEQITRLLKDTQHCPMSLQNLHFNYNQSDDSGVHTLQRIYGCEVFSNGSFSTFYMRYGYDGQDKLSLDPETLSWIASDNVALNVKFKLDADPSLLKIWQFHLKETTCIQALLRHLEKGKKTLLRTDPPSVQVTRHISSDKEVTLKCRAWGFYPAKISLIWLRDGEEQIQDTEYIETRPGGDGTFQKWAAVGMPFGNEEQYTCQVQHEGLPEPLSLKWKTQSASFGLIVIIFTAVLIAIVVGVVIWNKYTSGGKGGNCAMTRENDSAQGSDVSLTATA